MRTPSHKYRHAEGPVEPSDETDPVLVPYGGDERGTFPPDKARLGDRYVDRYDPSAPGDEAMNDAADSSDRSADAPPIDGWKTGK